MGERIGLAKGAHHSDDILDGFMDDASHFVEAFEGDLLVFDHPASLGVDTPFQVKHDLGVKPYSASIEDPGVTGGRVYWTLADREKWTADAITVRSSDVNNRRMSIRVRRKIGGA